MKESAKPSLSGAFTPTTTADTAPRRPREISAESRQELLDAGFELQAAVAVGGFGIVYRARDHRTASDVAVKVLDRVATQRRGSPQPREEVASLSALRHPHVVPLNAHGTLADGTVYLVMPWIDGSSLRARLQREHRLPIADVLRWGIDLADALAALHARGLVHRDVKPENVLIDGGHAMLIDLGLVCAMHPAADAGTDADPLIGTPAYMSPEQWQLGAALDGRSDVYALGCLLYELLTGSGVHERNPLRSRAQNPFLWSDSAHPSDLVDVTAEAPRREAPPLREKRPDAPAALERLLQQALAPDVAARLPSARAFKRELEDVLTSELSYSPQRRTRRWATIAAVSLALAIPITIGAARHFSVQAQLRALDDRRVVLMSVRNATGDPRHDAIAARLQSELSSHMREVLDAQLQRAGTEAGAITLVAPPEGPPPTRPVSETSPDVAATMRRVALGARAATVLMPAVTRDGGELVVRTDVVDVREPRRREMAGPLRLSAAASEVELHVVTESIARALIALRKGGVPDVR